MVYELQIIKLFYGFCTLLWNEFCYKGSSRSAAECDDTTTTTFCLDSYNHLIYSIAYYYTVVVEFFIDIVQC